MKLEERFSGKWMPEPNSGCWLWIGALDSNGYGRINLHGRNQTAHRVSWTIHRGSIPDGLCALHHCDTPACVNPDHLYLGTMKDNTRDMWVRNRAADRVGQSNGRAKLTPLQVITIRDDSFSTISSIARKFGVSRTAVRLIKQRKNWSHLH